MKTKENGESIQDAECLAQELQKYPRLYARNEKGNKGYKEGERAQGKCLESS